MSERSESNQRYYEGKKEKAKQRFMDLGCSF